jgi:hypothetical protein
VPDRAKAVESEKVNDKALFIVAMVIAAFLVAKGLYLETYGSLVDAVILLALGFGVRAGLHPARWLFAVYAFVTPILVIANGGGNAVIWPFVFYGVCRSLVNRGNGRFVHDTTTMNHRFPDTATQTSHTIVPTDIRQEISAPLSNETQKTPTSIAAQRVAFVDEDRIYAQIAEELETGIADKGLWTRLFAECSGDEKQTKVLYIKQRAERLIAAERLRLEQAARENTSETAKIVESRGQHEAEIQRLSVQTLGLPTASEAMMPRGHTWVMWVIGLLSVIGIITAIAIVLHDRQQIPVASRTSPNVDTETAKTVEAPNFVASSKCHTDHSCSTGLYCISGQCRQRGAARSPCERPIECADGFECRVGYCEAEYKPPTLAKGVGCATDGECASALYCVLGVCSEQAKAGQPCARNTECAGDLRCNNGVCMKARP